MPKTSSKSKTIVQRKPVKKNFYVHPTAMVEDGVSFGEGTKVWHFAQVRKNAQIGKNCVIGNSVFIDFDSQIGDNVKIQNHAIVYHEAIIANGVFIGPNVCFTNDKIPRAINPDGSPKSADDWETSTIRIGEGAAIGGHSVLTPGVTIGAWSMVGSGSIVSKDVPDNALVYGNPARIYDFVCKCGKRLKNKIGETTDSLEFSCQCGLTNKIAKKDYKLKINNSPPKKIWLK